MLLQYLMFFALWSMSTASMFSLKLKISVLQLVENSELLLVLLILITIIKFPIPLYSIHVNVHCFLVALCLQFKLCKVRSVQFGQKGIPYLNTYDGRTIRYPDPLIKANDTIKIDLETNKIVDFIKFDVGNVVMVTGGRNTGRVGVIKNREKHKGSFETIHVEDALGHQFATRLGNVFTIGKGNKPWVSLPKGKGIKLSIIEEQRKRDAAAQAAANA